MKPYTKQIELCLAAEDERELSAALLELHPQVAFVAGFGPSTSQPILGESIERCDRGLQVWLWERSVFPNSPIGVQYLKPFRNGDRLRSGRFATSGGGHEEPTESANNAFVKDVWRLVKEQTSDVQCVTAEGRILNTHVPAFRAGHHAAMWLAEKSGRFFTDASRNLYVPLVTRLAEKVRSKKPQSRRVPRAEPAQRKGR